MTTVGQTVRISATTTLDGTETDPTALTIAITKPNAAVLNYSYPPSGPNLIRDDYGKFYVDVVTDQAGTWSFLWNATGTVIDQASGTFLVTAATVTATIHTQTSAPANITGVRVNVFNSTTGYLVATGTTNSSGNLALSLVPGTYDVECSKAKSSFSNPTSITVTTTATFNITGSNYTITAPTKSLRRIFGYVLGMGGEPFPEASVHLQSVGTSSRSLLALGGTSIDAQGTGVAQEKRILFPDSQTGYWELDVLVGQMLQIRIPAMGFERVFRVPAGADPLNIVDARPDPGGSFLGISSDTPATVSDI